MAVDLFSLVMRVKAEGAAAAMADLRGIDAAGKQATLQATNFANAWQGALLQFKGGAGQVAAFKAQFSKGFFDEKLVAGMSLAGAEGRRASEGSAAWSRGLANIKTQNEAATASMAKQAGTASLLSSALKPMIGLYAGFSLFHFVKDTIEGAGALHELSQKTGASAETLSVLKFAGAQAGVSIEQSAIAFKGMAISLGNLRDGQEKTVAAYGRLGFTAESFKGLNPDQTFIKLATAVGAMKDETERAEVAQRVFGRSGSALIPLLEDIATRGWGKLREETEKGGGLFTQKAADQADAFTDALTRLKVSFQGLLRETLLPILPALTKFVDLLALAVKNINVLATGGLANFGAKLGYDIAHGAIDAPKEDVPFKPQPWMLTAEHLSSRNRNRFGPGTQLMSDEDAKKDTEEAARAAEAQRKQHQDEVLRLTGIGSMDPAKRLDFQGFPTKIATKGRIPLGDFGAGKGVPQGETEFDQFEQRVAQQAAQTQSHFSNLGTNLGMVLANGFSAAISAGIQGKNPFKAFGNVVLAGLGGIMQQMGHAMIEQGVVLLHLLPFLSNPFSSGPALIAAGVALSALGSALGGIASGRGGSGGGGSSGFHDRSTNITLTADGLGGRNAPGGRDPLAGLTLLSVDSPKGQRALTTSLKGAARRNMG
jgi:hypothetical protein